MFDKFENIQVIKKQNFAFQSSRFESWVAGKMVSSGQTEANIFANIIHYQGTEKVEINLDNFAFNEEISPKIIFDEFVTITDRLQLIIIPEETDVPSNAINMYRATFGATRQKKNFTKLEPYCCSLFLQNGALAKVTFSYSNPEKLLEFYNDSLIDYKYVESEDSFDFIRNSFEKLRKKVKNLPLNLSYQCDVYKSNEKKLISINNASFRFNVDEIFLEKRDGSGDYIIFSFSDGKLYCKLVAMNNQIIVDEEFHKVEFKCEGLSNIIMSFVVPITSK